ncbi:MAG: branched-chain amino acid ABC transporter permease [Lawsonibacter sp.]|nr:branched-chain amino acid ABC transporter permease [Lawsonibacter sp.]
MIQSKNKRGAAAALIACAALLAVIVLLENASVFLPASSVPNLLKPTSQLFAVLKKGAVYSLAAVSMNLLNGFTGLFSLGQAGFMLLGAYTYAILSVPIADRGAVYYLYGGSAIQFSFQDLFGSIFGTEGVGGAVSMGLGVVVAMVLAGCVAAVFAYFIGLPVLRLKSDYLAIATLGFAEIIKAVFQWQALGPVTNGANMIKSFPTFSSFNITGADGTVILRLSTFFPFLVSMICIAAICLLINSTYGRAFKAIREDETAAEAMGINLAKHKMLSFCTSAFFAGVSGAMFAMFVTNAQAKVYTTTMTYEILLIVVIGGIGSISGSVMATFLYVACSEWWLRFLDSEVVLNNGMKLPFLRAGFRMVVFSVVIMIVVLFFRKGIMGDKELPDLFRRRVRKEAAK